MIRAGSAKKRRCVLLWAVATIVAYSIAHLLHKGLDTDKLLSVYNDFQSSSGSKDYQSVDALERAVKQTKAQLDAIKQRLREDVLLDCVEIMARPNSPYADGSFITRHTTSHKWTPRHDGSRQFEIDICKLKRYTADDAKQCLANQHVNFIGDSLTRYQFFSLAYFLEKGQYPPRFGIPNGNSNCTHVDEQGVLQCSPPGEPNLCLELQWADVYGFADGWRRFFANVGGGEDGGIFGGRMECSCARDQWVENEVYATPPPSSTVLSSLLETGGGKQMRPIQGFVFTGCALNGTCRSSFEKVLHRDQHGKIDFQQLLVDALHPDTGVLTRNNNNVLATPTHPNITIYNRGIWGLLDEPKATAVFPLLYNWTGRQHGRCLFKSTTGNTDLVRMHTHELNVIRDIVFRSGCSFLDYGHITQDFGALHWPPNANGGLKWNYDERNSIYWDRYHFLPWVYEELNNILLNVLCNHKQ